MYHADGLGAFPSVSITPSATDTPSTTPSSSNTASTSPTATATSSATATASSSASTTATPSASLSVGASPSTTPSPSQTNIPRYAPYGPQVNVPEETVLSAWTLCYSEPYNTFGTLLTTVTSACPQANIMMACRPVGQSVITLLGWAPVADVFFDAGNGYDYYDSYQTANGLNWYFSTSWSWGFGPANEAVDRNSCDTDGEDGEDRLCWHTSDGTLQGGGGAPPTLGPHVGTLPRNCSVRLSTQPPLRPIPFLPSRAGVASPRG